MKKLFFACIALTILSIPCYATGYAFRAYAAPVVVQSYAAPLAVTTCGSYSSAFVSPQQYQVPVIAPIAGVSQAYTAPAVQAQVQSYAAPVVVQSYAAPIAIAGSAYSYRSAVVAPTIVRTRVGGLFSGVGRVLFGRQVNVVSPAAAVRVNASAVRVAPARAAIRVNAPGVRVRVR